MNRQKIGTTPVSQMGLQFFSDKPFSLIGFRSNLDRLSVLIPESDARCQRETASKTHHLIARIGFVMASYTPFDEKERHVNWAGL